MNITTDNYHPPHILTELGWVEISSKLNTVIFTWREDIVNGDNHNLRIKHKTVGNIADEYFSTTYASEFHMSDKGPVFFMRKYTEPEPTFGAWGPEESLKSHYQRTTTKETEQTM